MRIALDAMGGDDAPLVNVAGAIEALQEHSSLEISLVGDRPVVDELIDKQGYSGDRLEVVEADGFVGMHEKPMDALRQKPNCSIANCWKMMAAGQVDAVISAGNTGGVVAAGLRTRLFLKGVKRPGISVVLPTVTGRSVLLDVGANPGARPEHLAQYAIMGTVFAREMLQIESPRVGLMNIGSEDGKGTPFIKEAHDLIVQGPVASNYIGNIEGRGLYQGEADVIICEGFVGNVVLKVSEGMASMMMQRVAHQVLGSLNGEKSTAEEAFGRVGRSFEYNEYGGAPLLGIDGICLICHGSSDARSIRNALSTALTFGDRKVNQQIVETLSVQAATNG
ncbi:phosphate acyltransferase PlsX [Thalassoglobus sp. JC818]|uniref:phosphate acyltransferase PlsX n=1 Tax=Thalassoglobus sp. JC818 TaxID=3232136 RepID=UPI003457BBD6